MKIEENNTSLFYVVNSLYEWIIIYKISSYISTKIQKITLRESKENFQNILSLQLLCNFLLKISK